MLGLPQDALWRHWDINDAVAALAWTRAPDGVLAFVTLGCEPLAANAPLRSLASDWLTFHC